MPQPLVEITRREEFSAAHRLHDPRLSEEENRRLYGPCSTDHGHNYAVEVSVRGPVASTGMVLDLNHLMGIVREEIVSAVDHRHLNRDVPFLRGVNPTAENVAVAFWNRLAPRLAAFEGVKLQRVRVCESRDNVAEYCGETG